VSDEKFEEIKKDKGFIITHKVNNIKYGLEKHEWKKCNSFQGLTCAGVMPEGMANEFKKMIISSNTEFHDEAKNYNVESEIKETKNEKQKTYNHIQKSSKKQNVKETSKNK